MDSTGYEIVDNDAILIGERYAAAKGSLTESVRLSIECGQMLIAKKATMKHGEWIPWLEHNEAVLGFSTGRTAQRLMKLVGSNTTPASLLTDETAQEISRKLWGHSQPANYSSATNEWYTPPNYITAVRNVLGQIDLDPASCAEANKCVGAETYFTSGALEKDWHGNVFLNPPYGVHEGESVAGMFCRKAISEYQSKKITAAIILVNSSHSQKWQAPLYSFPVCFVGERICFYDIDGVENPNPTFQNIFVYLGSDKERFFNVFSDVGYVMVPFDG